MRLFRHIFSLQILLLSGTFIATAVAGDLPTVRIPRDFVSAPAKDLMYLGQRIDRDRAAQIRIEGQDLSLLDPEANDLWTPNPLPIADPAHASFPADGATVQMIEATDASKFYRARVTDGQNTYFLIIDLDNHRSLATSALLRKLGYLMPMPKYYGNLKLRFQDRDQYDQFMGKAATSEKEQPIPSDVVLATGKDVKRWTRDSNPETFEVTLKDVNLESARVQVPRYYQGTVDPEWIDGRRASRAAIVPLSLMNFMLSKYSLNLYSWEAGRIDSSSILLEHPYAGSFTGVAFEDARWIALRIAALDDADWAEIAAAAQFKDRKDIELLLFQKFKSRRNQLRELTQVLKNKFMRRLPADLAAKVDRRLDFNPRITEGKVVKGEVIEENDDDFAARLAVADPESPLRWAELKHYVKIEVLAQAIAGGLSKMNDLLRFEKAEDGLLNHLEKVIGEIKEHFTKNPDQPYVMPIRAWAAPIYGLNVNASRNIVTGTYYGSESKVQLVDNLSVGANVGAFGGMDGKKYFVDLQQGLYKLTGTAVVSYQRNYTHVRPLPSLQASKKENWLHLFVPGFMKSLGKIVDPSITKKSDAEILAAINELLGELREGEVFTITDSFNLRGGPSYTIPLTALMGPGLTALSPSVGFGVTGEFAVVNRVMITRREGRLEVYDNRLKTRGVGANVDLNAWINVARATWQKKGGNAQTDALMLDLSVADEPMSSDPKYASDRKGLLKSLHAIFRQNEIEAVKKLVPVHHLDHKLKSRLVNGKVLLWSWNDYRQIHKVRITPPKPSNDPEKQYDPEKHVRTLYQVRKVNLAGRDIYGLFGQALSRLVKTQGLFSTNGDLNPSNTFLGKANHSSVSTDAELTDSKPFTPMVFVEDSYNGWFLKKDKLLDLLSSIEAEMKAFHPNSSSFRKEVFNSTQQVQAYEVRSTTMVFPEGVDRLVKMLREPKSRRHLVMLLMDFSLDRNLRDRCQAYLQSQGVEAELEQLETLPEGKEIEHRCVQSWMTRLMRWVRKAPSKERKEEYVQWVNKIFDFLQRKTSFQNVLKRIGEDQFFFLVRVSGFRTKDENGDVPYITDTAGSVPVDPETGPATQGAFRDLKVYSNDIEWRLLDYELQARYYGSGL